jgi:hypothetical protein
MNMTLALRPSCCIKASPAHAAHSLQVPHTTRCSLPHTLVQAENAAAAAVRKSVEAATPEQTVALVHAGVLAVLVRLLRSKQLTSQQEAAAALSSLAAIPSLRAKLLSAGALPPLLAESITRGPDGDPILQARSLGEPVSQSQPARCPAVYPDHIPRPHSATVCSPSHSLHLTAP